MRGDDNRSTTFQTKTGASDEKSSGDRVVDEVSHRSQTSAIGLGGRKAENPHSQVIAKALVEAKAAWLESGDRKSVV